MPPRKTASTATVSRRVCVLIKDRKDVGTQVPKVVWNHELPVLELIHGAGNIVSLENTVLNQDFKAKAAKNLLPWNRSQDSFTPPSDNLEIGFAYQGEMEAEYERLCLVYGRNVDVNQPNAETVYGRFQEGRFSDLFCAGEFSDMPDAQLRQIIRAHGWVPVTDKDSTKEEREFALTRHREVLEGKRERLLELVAELESVYA